MNTIYAIVFVLLLVSGSGCMSDPKEAKLRGDIQYKDINVQQAKEMIERGEVYILDVRTSGEYAAGHINGSTLLAVQDIPAQELDNRLKEIPRDRKILVYCRTGHRSAQASKILAEKGYPEVYNMQGGISEWMNAGYEIVK